MLRESRADYSRSRYTDVYLGVILAYSVECSRHKGIVLGRVAEYHYLCRPEAVVILGSLRGLHNDLTHHRHRVHIYARLGRAYVHRGAHVGGFRESFGYRFDKLPVACRKAFVHQRGISADIIHARTLSNSLEGLGEFHGALLCGSRDHR